jgi:hypothetical protein
MQLDYISWPKFIQIAIWEQIKFGMILFNRFIGVHLSLISYTLKFVQ